MKMAITKAFPVESMKIFDDMYINNLFNIRCDCELSKSIVNVIKVQQFEIILTCLFNVLKICP